MPFGGPSVRPLFRSLAIPASGLSAQRERIDVIARNIANAEVTWTADGGPYRRQYVALEATPFVPPAVPGQVGAAVPPASGWASAPSASGWAPVPPTPPQVVGPTVALPYGGVHPVEEVGGVRVAGIFEDGSEGVLVYEPGHPDADEAGYVRYPNVRITDELVELMEARRVYEANAAVFEAVKSMLRRAVEI